MMDSFERFGLPRQLVLDSGLVEEAIREELKRAHPDAGGGEGEFEQLRQAADLIKSPMGRLAMALEILGRKINERGSVPGKVMDFFAPVAGTLQKVDCFVAARGKAVSGLGKAVLDARVPGLKRALEELLEEIVALEDSYLGRFGRFDEEGWERCLDEMGEVHRAMSFLRKWLAQLREATGKIFEALLAG
ncbi:MAG: hypothetical protein ACJAT6_001646 [Akkermansiaceae bacterium]|jgi:hypothetical protein|tara:strand:- start:1594 stop:2163 length:570 start_codon:yes stop_codon:yes gene_type:complete